MSSLHRGWHCASCSRDWDAGEDVRACPCGGLPDAVYDLSRAADRWPSTQGAGDGSIWDFDFLLPARSPGYRSLGEGATPLRPLPRLAAEVGLLQLWCKDEGCNPSGSFKARGLAAAINAAAKAGAAEVAVATAGNAGGACAAFAAANGMRAHVFAPRLTSPVTIAEVRGHGAELNLVDGDISAAYAAMGSALEANPSWRNVSVSSEPHRIEGKRTMALELALQSRLAMPAPPRWIVFPTGGGVGIVAHARAFREMRETGVWEGSMPHIVAAQSAGCAPLARALAEPDALPEAWSEPSETLAEGLRVPGSGLHRRVAEILRETGGTALGVSERDILRAMRDCARREGFLLSPEGAAAVATIRSLCEEHKIPPDEPVVFYNTASAYKYPEALAQVAEFRAGE